MDEETKQQIEQAVRDAIGPHEAAEHRELSRIGRSGVWFPILASVVSSAIAAVGGALLTTQKLEVRFDERSAALSAQVAKLEHQITALDARRDLGTIQEALRSQGERLSDHDERIRALERQRR